MIDLLEVTKLGSRAPNPSFLLPRATGRPRGRNSVEVTFSTEQGRPWRGRDVEVGFCVKLALPQLALPA